jgi:hypothetical protein
LLHYDLLVKETIATIIAITTPTIWIQRPILPPTDEKFDKRVAAPLVNKPRVRKSPVIITNTGSHRQRKKNNKAAGTRSIKNTGGTLGYGTPEIIWIVTPAVAIIKHAIVSLLGAEIESVEAMVCLGFIKANNVYTNKIRK